MAPSELPDRAESDRHGHHSELSGSASEVVQARDIRGGVHFHGIDVAAGMTPRQLPSDVGAFVNRTKELTQLDGILADERAEASPVGIYVVTGTAGVGKTSLVLHWAHGIRHRFPDGQFYLNLCGYDPGPPVKPEQALDRFLRALGMPPSSIPMDLDDKSALYRSLVAGRRLLVVLDNAATVKQVRPLLPGTADCLVLVTSRSRLSGLVARNGAQRLSVDVLPEAEAVNLLRTVTADYRDSDAPEELVELARLCARLPLALRIAAERASSRPLMPLSDLITELRDESSLWDALTADDDDEADAVRTVFAWSYRALPADAARMFRLLGLHPGPDFGISAAAAITGVGPPRTRQALDVLVGAHMLEQYAPRRYRLHDLLRAYAADQALQHETPQSLRSALRRVLSWYLWTAANAAIAFAPSERRVSIDAYEEQPAVASEFAGPSEAYDWYEEERENLAAAIRAASDAGLHEFGWQLPAVLSVIHGRQHLFDEWIGAGETGLASARRVENRYGEAQMLESLGQAYTEAQQLDRAEELHRNALAIRREISDRQGQAMSINALGILASHRHRYTEALADYEESIAIARELGDRDWEALLLGNLGMTYYDLTLLESAADTLHTAVMLCREVNDRRSEGNALCYLAMAQREMGRTDEAMDTIQTALAIAREDDHHAFEAFWLQELARVERALGRTSEALASYQHAAATHRRLRDRAREAMALDGTGETYQELGRPDEAAKFHRLAINTYRELDIADRMLLATALANLAASLQEDRNSDEARPHWEEAAAVLAELDDPRAVLLRHRIDEALER
ncbi:ATP-binding protein [Nocardia mexicana]|uniref:Anaphase-promoting complex subunit 5 n=1 Tax=Nocardia mexicana TaxID=279262 RepID=A0A370GML5_9NOCA|nr:tetratricopeptide repeat protein [Nocardia mexicana]RDI44965.1 anaphase-promoting complex subunit 5 [Nocardia mexicana]